MNGLNCRLLDVQEFLGDVGIGKQQHTIISQGQIAEILNSKPEDHRITIEEAAGILPFKSKKEILPILNGGAGTGSNRPIF